MKKSEYGALPVSLFILFIISFLYGEYALAKTQNAKGTPALEKRTSIPEVECNGTEKDKESIALNYLARILVKSYLNKKRYEYKS